MLRKEHKINIIKKDDILFPNKFKKLKDCPQRIYATGNVEILNSFMVAIIGARECSFESMKIARKIGEKLARAGIIIVSGFAKGIDGIAHSECVKNNAQTVAVLGTGFDKIYPKQNRYLIDEIIENNGLIVSEHGAKEQTQPYFFSLRNRLIAALADVVIVIEAKEKSGSLVTVKYAQKLRKSILVVPGNAEDYRYKRK